MEHYNVEQMIRFARRLDPGLTDSDFADAGRRLDQWGDGVFAPYGLSMQDVARLRSRLAGWPRDAPQRPVDPAASPADGQ